MAETQQRTQVNRDNASYESWIWLFGKMKMEFLELDKQPDVDPKDAFWHIWAHCYPYCHGQAWFDNLWKIKDLRDEKGESELKQADMMEALGKMSVVAAEKAWDREKVPFAFLA